MQRQWAIVIGVFSEKQLFGFYERGLDPFSAGMFAHCKLHQLQLGQAVHY